MYVILNLLQSSKTSIRKYLFVEVWHEHFRWICLSSLYIIIMYRIMEVLKVGSDSTSIRASPKGRVMLLVIMYVENFKIEVIDFITLYCIWRHIDIFLIFGCSLGSLKGILKLVLTYIFSPRTKVVSFQFNCKNNP
jgi:hypothetical protein